MTAAAVTDWRAKAPLWVLAGLLVVMPVLKYQALASNWFDLGLFENAFHVLGTAGGIGHAFHGHAQPFMPVYALLYRLSGPMGLLALQSLALVVPAWALWRQYGFLPALAFLLYYPLWANALFDFHFDHLAVPLLVGFFIAYERRRVGGALLCALLLAWVKEPFALQTAACGLFLLWQAACHRSDPLARRWRVAGGILVLAGMGWFYAATQWLIPHFTGSRGGLDAEAFTWLGGSLGAMAWHLLTHPWLPFTEALSNPLKLLYLAVCFGSLAFVPVLRPQWLIPAIPPLLIAMLARSENYYSYGNHYTAGLIGPLLVAFAHGLPTVRRLAAPWRIAAGPLVGAALLAAHVALAPSPLGRLFWSDKVWHYSRAAYLPDARTARIKAAIDQWIPADGGVSVSTQNTVNWGHMPRREAYFVFPDGVFEPKAVTDGAAAQPGRDHPGPLRYADYVVLDAQRPWFLGDQGCHWLFGRCADERAAARYRDTVAAARRHYTVVYEDDGFAILRRQAGEAP